MGQSTDAFYFYGICWDEKDHEWPWNTSDADEETGWVDPDDWLEAHGLTDEITLGDHCSDSAAMGFAAVKDTFVRAYRGYPKQVTPSDGDRGLLNEPLIKFCEAAGYDFRALNKAGKVGWWLCSYWSM